MTYVVRSAAHDTAEAVLEIGRGLRRRGARAGAALVFASSHHTGNPGALGDALRDAIPLPHIGWTGRSAFAYLRAHELQPSLVALVLDDVDAYARAVLQDGLGSHVAAGLIADAPVGRARFLAAPRAGFDGLNLLASLDEQQVPIAGGQCSTRGPTGTALCSAKAPTPAAALLTLDGCDIVSVVSPGAFPLGGPREVTRAEKNVVRELDGRPALEAISEDVPEPVRANYATGALLAGLHADDDAVVLRRVTGVDPTTGAIALDELGLDGRDLSFYARDARTARQDLEEALHGLAAEIEDRDLLATLVFTADHRDERHLGSPLYDVARVDDVVGRGQPVVGISCPTQVATYGRSTQAFGHACVVTAILAS
jgi:small ligand-binding sensory domain FIST